MAVNPKHPSKRGSPLVGSAWSSTVNGLSQLWVEPPPLEPLLGLLCFLGRPQRLK